MRASSGTVVRISGIPFRSMRKVAVSVRPMRIAGKLCCWARRSTASDCDVETIARADAAKAFTYADLDKNVQYSWVLEPAVDDAFRLIAADAAGVRPNLSTAVMAKVLTARQNRGGDWPSARTAGRAAPSRRTPPATGRTRPPRR